MKRVIRTFQQFSFPDKNNPLVRKKRKTVRILSAVGFSGMIISGCLSSLDNSLFSPFSIDYPQEYSSENPAVLTRDDIAEDAKPIEITYPEGTQTPLNMYFNGQNVSECYTYDETQFKATATLHCMREYIRQGKNTITINPQSLFLGTTRTFLLDTEGPQVNIKKVCFKASADCTQDDSGNVEVTVDYIDPSNIETTTLNGLDPLNEEGSTRTFLVPVSDTYRFDSTDSNSYVSKNTYKADGQRVNEVAKIRVAEDILTEFLPLINKGASGMESGQADGSGEPVLKDLTIDIIGIKIAADVKYIKVGTMDMQQLTIGDSAPYPLTMEMYMEPLGERDVDWVDNNNAVEDTGDVGVEVLLSMRDYTQCWSTFPWGCGWIGLTEAKPCPIKGWDRCNYGITINMDMRMYIERLKVTSAIDLSVDQGKFDIKLNEHNGQNVIAMHDVKASLSGEQTNGGQKEGFIDGIIGAPAISGLIKGIVEDTINRNMEELKLEKSFDFETGAEMNLSGRIESMYTDGGDSDNIGNLYVDMSAVFKTVTPDKTIPPALGSYYVDDKPLPSQVDKGSSLGVVLNSNIVNQALLAMYNTGATHLTMLNSKMYTGLGITDDLGKNKDVRVELIPSSPGEFFMAGEATHQAYIAFRGAEMVISYKKNDAWVPFTRLNIDIKAGVKMDVVDGFLHMTIAGTPEYHINKMDDLGFENSDFGFSIASKTIEFLIQRIVEWGVPLIADTYLKIDVSQAGISEKLYTESVNATGGHLNFETSVKESP